MRRIILIALALGGLFSSCRSGGDDGFVDVEENQPVKEEKSNEEIESSYIIGDKIPEILNGTTWKDENGRLKISINFNKLGTIAFSYSVKKPNGGTFGNSYIGVDAYTRISRAVSEEYKDGLYSITFPTYDEYGSRTFTIEFYIKDAETMVVYLKPPEPLITDGRGCTSFGTGCISEFYEKFHKKNFYLQFKNTN